MRLRQKTVVIGVLLLVFAGAVTFALLREVWREQALLAKSISGVVEVERRLYALGIADIVRTDRLALMLVDPETREPVALTFVNPLVPPQTIRVGQADARGERELSGAYLMVGITDKDGEIFKVTPGEVYGRSPEPVALGSEKVRLVLSERFRGSLFNEAGAAPRAGSRAPAVSTTPEDPEYSISGTITVSRALAGRVERADRLVVLLFDPQQARPVAFKIIPHALLPQQFRIALPPEARAGAKPGYELRVVTDKNDDPFGAAEGEVAGRSNEPVPLGTAGLVFELNQPYTR